MKFTKAAKLCSVGEKGCTKQALTGGVTEGTRQRSSDAVVKDALVMLGKVERVKEMGPCKVCSSEGCATHAQNGGVCRRHGAKVKLYSSEGCTNQIICEGVCW